MKLQSKLFLFWCCFFFLMTFKYFFTSVSSMPEHPESFPVNALVPIPGTPLEGNDVNLQPSPVTAF
jgi:hypothetical protein